MNGQVIPGLNVNNVTGLPQASISTSRGTTPTPISHAPDNSKFKLLHFPQHFTLALSVHLFHYQLHRKLYLHFGFPIVINNFIVSVALGSLLNSVPAPSPTPMNQFSDLSGILSQPNGPNLTSMSCMGSSSSLSG